MQDTKAGIVILLLFKVTVDGPLGHFFGSVLIDTGCIVVLNLCEHMALQLGIIPQAPRTADELADSSTSGVTCR